MPTKIALHHKSSYRYERPISLGPQSIRLRPAAHTRSRILAYSLTIEPEKHFLNWQQDPGGNFVARVSVPERTLSFGVTVDLIAELPAVNPFDFFTEEYAREFPFEYDSALLGELAPFRSSGAPAGSGLSEYLRDDLFATARARNTTETIVAVNQRVAADVSYLIRMEPGVQSPEETLAKGSGSCRDSAYLLVSILRHMGFAARFVSGYLIQLTTDAHTAATLAELHPEAPRGPESDFTDLHAWAEVFVPGAGWLGLDATSGLLTGEGHIPLAAVSEPPNAAPISGTAEVCETEFDFEMSLRRLSSAPPDQSLSVRSDSKQSSAAETGGTAPWARDTAARLFRSETPAGSGANATPGALAGEKAGEDTSGAKLEAQLDLVMEQVDRDLAARGLRLTMGGEPTFVHYDNPEAPEWNLAAMGGDKRELAARLTYRLGAAFAPGGVYYHGQGKWYPGEELPRWALGVFFRVDGRPLWRHPQYLAREGDAQKPGEAPDQKSARGFIEALARNLGAAQEAIRPAFEDPYFRLWEAGGAFDPTGAQPKRLRELFDTTRSTVAACVLPLQPNPARSFAAGDIDPDENENPAPDWLTCRWAFRRGGLYLIPGDSPAGYRLPLNRIPHHQAPGYEVPDENDPIQFGLSEFEAAAAAKRGPGETSTTGAGEAPGAAASVTQPDTRNAGENESDDLARRIARRAKGNAAAPAEFIFQTALTVEVREDRLRVFLPPLTRLEAYCDLIASIEATAVQLDQPVILEGYPPPVDPRLNRLMVTPDPGVIEVNVHPARSWQELKTITHTLYRCAREERLIAEKFQNDGRPMGTGGGNHITLGGRTPGDSPFLLRPDLLRSMITYWQHHPSLSYLFAGLFVGPTSQAPRIDEARHEALYDLELAFASFAPFQFSPAAAEAPSGPFPMQASQLWLIDRLLRNVLVDLTGNTHRSEFCIDKLFPGENLATRLGLVELRAFEMPRGPDSYLSVIALIRALVARFARKPYHEDLIRWGTHLHDRFMLPYYLWRDFAAVIADLKDHGYAFRLAECFADAFEFRFPLYGETRIESVELELRAAMEPWPVLGETSVAGGTSRPVDAALERLQVRVQGFDPARHTLSCNGAAVPLQTTDIPGDYVAGVRFKAWAPPNTLHPLAPAHSRLVFDLLDNRSRRSLGGCTYHVSHPGGRAYDGRPVNGVEAEARRQARFEHIGHTGGDLTAVPRPRIHPEYPVTLDLRESPGVAGESERDSAST